MEDNGMCVKYPGISTPLRFLAGLAVACAAVGCQDITSRPIDFQPVRTQDGLSAPILRQTLPGPVPVTVKPAAAAHSDKPFPINLPTALQLTNARAIDIALVDERLRVAVARLERAKVLWLPTVYVGADYFRHDGQQQLPSGDLVGASRGSLLFGAGPYAVFAVTDAIFSPLAERQVVRARQAAVQAATNDTSLAVEEAYFNVQQARGELAGAEDAWRRTDDLVRKTQALATGLVLPVEVSRARTELARRNQSVSTARERWRTASAELVRLLRLDPSVLLEPQELPDLRITLLPLDQPVNDLIHLARTNRPEFAANQAMVGANFHRLRQERLRPLIPNVMLRGASTGVPGTLAGGVFGGGGNNAVRDFGARLDVDIQLLWELENLGFGNRARIHERHAEYQLSIHELTGVEDRIAAEVAQAYAQAQSAAERASDAETELKEALDTVEKTFQGLEQMRRAGNLLIPVIRPQEAVVAVQALAQAYNDYFDSSADYNRTQFRLYRALGHPAQALVTKDGTSPVP